MLLQPKPPQPRKLEGWAAKVQPSYGIQYVDLNPFYPPKSKAPYPPRLMRTPVRDGDSPIHRRSTGKSLPMAVGGSVAAISGTAPMIAVTNVFELGPGHAR